MEIKQTVLMKSSALSILFSDMCHILFIFFSLMKQKNYLKNPNKAILHCLDSLTCQLCLGTFCAEASSKSEIIDV